MSHNPRYTRPGARRSYTVTRRRGERGFGLVLGLVLTLWAFYAALFIGAIYVAYHFISKFW
jgi:hypothetical protein